MFCCSHCVNIDEFAAKHETMNLFVSGVVVNIEDENVKGFIDQERHHGNFRSKGKKNHWQ